MGNRALTFTSDSIEHQSIGSRFGPVHFGDHAGDRRGANRGLREKRFDDLLVELAAVGMAKGPASTAVLRTRGNEGWTRFATYRLHLRSRQSAHEDQTSGRSLRRPELHRRCPRPDRDRDPRLDDDNAVLRRDQQDGQPPRDRRDDDRFAPRLRWQSTRDELGQLVRPAPARPPWRHRRGELEHARHDHRCPPLRRVRDARSIDDLWVANPLALPGRAPRQPGRGERPVCRWGRFYAPGLGPFTQLDTSQGTAQNPLSLDLGTITAKVHHSCGDYQVLYWLYVGYECTSAYPITTTPLPPTRACFRTYVDLPNEKYNLVRAHEDSNGRLRIVWDVTQSRVPIFRPDLTVNGSLSIFPGMVGGRRIFPPFLIFHGDGFPSEELYWFGRPTRTGYRARTTLWRHDEGLYSDMAPGSGDTTAIRWLPQ